MFSKIEDNRLEDSTKIRCGNHQLSSQLPAKLIQDETGEGKWVQFEREKTSSNDTRTDLILPIRCIKGARARIWFEFVSEFHYS